MSRAGAWTLNDKAAGGRSGDGAAALVRLGVVALFVAGVAMLFLISPQRLDAWKINYDGEGGVPFAKIHPGDWAILAALALASLRSGNPLAFFNRAARWTGLTMFFACWAMLFVFIVFLEKTPFTPIVDTFLLPMALFVLIAQRACPNQSRVALLIHLLMAANGALGIIEFLTGWRLTPFTAAGVPILDDWRSTAFLGHPLDNAAITGCYILSLALGGGRDLPAWLRPAAVTLQLVAMIAFGGRAALVLGVVILSVLAMLRMLHVLCGGRVSTGRAAAICFLAPFVIGAVIFAAQAGFFDRFLERFVADKGSAEARVIMFEVFSKFPIRQILLGPDQTWLRSLQAEYGIEFGIESFWVGFILEHGLIISGVFFAGLAAFCVDLVRATRPAMVVLLLYFFAVASTSNSLSVKTCSFGLFVVMTMILLRPAERTAAHRRGEIPR